MTLYKVSNLFIFFFYVFSFPVIVLTITTKVSIYIYIPMLFVSITSIIALLIFRLLYIGIIMSLSIYHFL